MTSFVKWKSFDFGPETCVDQEPTPKTEKKVIARVTRSDTLKDTRKLKKPSDVQKKLAPKCTAEIAVHPKKIQEVEGWLKYSLSNNSQNFTPMLLISGPTGSGKTSTVLTLCKALGASCSEWINPVDIDYEILQGPNQMARFLEFFCESKYPSLFDSGKCKKVILVKDYPNAFIRNPTEFHNILEEIYYKNTHPVVFICTDTCSNDVNIQRTLFPEAILMKYTITTYSFNACAPTLLKKALKRAQDLIQEESDFYQCPSSVVIEAILASSMGDIRSAMNQFYLASLKGSKNLPTEESKFSTKKAGGKRKRGQGGAVLKHMFRDEGLGLFHGLGRVLNPKRIEKEGSWRISCNIERLIDEFSVQPTKFVSFLFENYLRYFGSLNDATKSGEILSQSTLLMENWEHHETLVMSLWICVLGLMIFNEHKVSRWNQIKGPQKVDKICVRDGHFVLSPTDRFYYNLITKSNKFHKFSAK